MAQQNKIPKRMFMYFGGRKLSYLRYMTFYSFIKQNPDWDVTLYVPKFPSTVTPEWSTEEQSVVYTGEDYLPKLIDLGVDIIPFDFSIIGVDNNLNEIFKSDIIRNYLIYAYGGYYCDTDILFTAPLPDVGDADTVVCIHENNPVIGLIGGCKLNRFYMNMFGRSSRTIGKGYQSHGVSQYDYVTIEELRKKYTELTIYNLDFKSLYWVHWTEANRFWESDIIVFPRTTFGLHWFGGSCYAGLAENHITIENYKEYTNVICDKIEELYND